MLCIHVCVDAWFVCMISIIMYVYLYLNIYAFCESILYYNITMSRFNCNYESCSSEVVFMFAGYDANFLTQVNS